MPGLRLGFSPTAFFLMGEHRFIDRLFLETCLGCSRARPSEM